MDITGFWTEVTGFTKIFRTCKGTDHSLADLISVHVKACITGQTLILRSTQLFYYTGF